MWVLEVLLLKHSCSDANATTVHWHPVLKTGYERKVLEAITQIIKDTIPLERTEADITEDITQYHYVQDSKSISYN